MILRAFILALMLIAPLSPVSAQSPSSPVIRIESAWARPTPPMAKTAAAYMTVTNTGTADDRLVSVSTPVAGEADVHTTINDNGVMKMRPAGALELKPGAPVTLSPGGLHVMMMDLKQPLAEGQTFPLTLVFEKAGKVETTVHVQKSAGAGTMPMNMDHDHMMDSGQMNMDHGKMGH